MKVVKIHILDLLPAMSDLIGMGIPARWRNMCWNGLSAHRPPDVPASSDVCCSFGAQVSPHLLSSCWHIEGFYLSKDSGVYVRAYGTTLSSVLTAKHDSTASFLAREYAPAKRRKANKQSARLLPDGRGFSSWWRQQSEWRKKKIHYTTMRNVCAPLFASFDFIKTFAAFIPFKGTQGYSKSGWQCVGMYTKCQLLSKPFFFSTRKKCY